MTETVEVLNGDDRTLTLRRLQEAAKGASPANRELLLAVRRSLNPHNPAARGRSSSEKSMKKHRKATAHHRRKAKRKTNPTHHPKAARRYTRRSNPTARFGGASYDLKGILVESAAVLAGTAAGSFAQRQVTRFMPTLNPTVSGAIAAGAVVLAAHFAGKKSPKYRSVAKGAAVGAVVGFAKTILAAQLPSLFAGTDDYGYGVDPRTGLVMPSNLLAAPALSDGGIGGAIYEDTDTDPAVDAFSDGNY